MHALKQSVTIGVLCEGEASSDNNVGIVSGHAAAEGGGEAVIMEQRDVHRALGLKIACRERDVDLMTSQDWQTSTVPRTLVLMSSLWPLTAALNLRASPTDFFLSARSTHALAIWKKKNTQTDETATKERVNEGSMLAKIDTTANTKRLPCLPTMRTDTKRSKRRRSSYWQVHKG